MATLDLSTFEQPQAYGKDLSATCSVQHVKQSPAKPQSESSPVNIVHLNSRITIGDLEAASALSNAIANTYFFRHLEIPYTGFEAI